MRQHRANLKQARPSMNWKDIKADAPPTPRKQSHENADKPPAATTCAIETTEDVAMDEKKLKEQRRKDNLKEKRRKQREEFKQFVQRNKAAVAKQPRSDDTVIEVFVPQGRVPVFDVSDEGIDPFERTISAGPAATPSIINEQHDADDLIHLPPHRTLHNDEDIGSENGDIIFGASDDPHAISSSTTSIQNVRMSNAENEKRSAMEKILDHALLETNGSDEDSRSYHEKQHKLSVRIERLRQYCERKCGEQLFLELYRFLKDVGQDDDDDGVQRGLVEILERGNMSVSDSHIYISKINQLIYVEQLFYG